MQSVPYMRNNLKFRRVWGRDFGRFWSLGGGFAGAWEWFLWICGRLCVPCGGFVLSELAEPSVLQKLSGSSEFQKLLELQNFFRIFRTFRTSKTFRTFRISKTFRTSKLSELQKLSEPIDCLKIIGFPFSKSMVHRKSIVLLCRTNRLPKNHGISFFKSMVHRKSMVFLFKTNRFPIQYSSI